MICAREKRAGVRATKLAAGGKTAAAKQNFCTASVDFACTFTSVLPHRATSYIRFQVIIWPFC